MIEALTIHYWQKPLDEAAMKMYVRDWIADVRHLPPDVLYAACTQWRRSAEKFMPTPGQLLAIADPILSFRKRVLDRARELAKYA